MPAKKKAGAMSHPGQKTLQERGLGPQSQLSGHRGDEDISSPTKVECSVGIGPTDVHPKRKLFDSFAHFADFALDESKRSPARGGRYICGPLDPTRPNGKGSTRNKLAVLPRNWIGLDIDGCPSQQAKALLRWAKRWRGFAYATSSDDPATSRHLRLVWEVEMLFDRTAGIALGNWIGNALASVAPHANVDRCAFLGEQPIYLPLRGAWSERWDDAPAMPLQIGVPAISERASSEGLRSIDARPVEGMTVEHAADLLAHLPAHWGMPGSGTWYKVAAALDLQFDGSDEAYQLLDQWSSTREGYDPEGNEGRWAIGFSHEGNVLTMRGLAHEAKKTGWDWPPELRQGSGYSFALDAKGNASWFLSRRGNRYLNIDADGNGKDCHLLAFVGTHWRFANDLRMLREDMEALEAELVECAERCESSGDQGAAKQLRAWAAKCRTKATTQETAWHLSRVPELRVRLSDFDTQPHLLAVKNGVIDLDQGELVPHGPHHRLMSFIDVNFDSRAEAPHWLGLLEHSSGGDPGWLDFVQRALGYAISGHIREQAMVFFHGLPATGKSTLMEALRDILGPELAQVLANATVCVNRFGGAQYELASLIGKRLAVVPEVNSDDDLDVELLKRLSGGDTIKARMIFQEPVEFRPRAKLVLVGNSLPPVDAANEAFWRRVYVVPFEHVVPVDQRDKHLADRLREEASGILAWLVAGYRMWMERPLSEDVPDVIRSAVASYRAKTDPKELWYATQTEPKGKTATRVLYRDYVEWHGKNRDELSDEEPISEKGFGLWLDGKGHSVRRTAQAKLRQSIRLVV